MLYIKETVIIFLFGSHSGLVPSENIVCLIYNAGRVGGDEWNPVLISLPFREVLLRKTLLNAYENLCWVWHIVCGRV